MHKMCARAITLRGIGRRVWVTSLIEEILSDSLHSLNCKGSRQNDDGQARARARKMRANRVDWHECYSDGPWTRAHTWKTLLRCDEMAEVQDSFFMMWEEKEGGSDLIENDRSWISCKYNWWGFFSLSACLVFDVIYLRWLRFVQWNFLLSSNQLPIHPRWWLKLRSMMTRQSLMFLMANETSKTTEDIVIESFYHFSHIFYCSYFTLVKRSPPKNFVMRWNFSTACDSCDRWKLLQGFLSLRCFLCSLLQRD